jgi:hypothetical protein
MNFTENLCLQRGKEYPPPIPNNYLWPSPFLIMLSNAILKNNFLGFNGDALTVVVK